MQSLSDDERKEVLGEVLAHELSAIHDLVKDVPSIKKDVHDLKESVDELQSDMKIVKAAVTDVSRQQKDHERRLIHLEAV
jgi:peptidoglycan hydrolase CwlO-like protein